MVKHKSVILVIILPLIFSFVLGFFCGQRLIKQIDFETLSMSFNNPTGSSTSGEMLTDADGLYYKPSKGKKAKVEFYRAAKIKLIFSNP